MIIEIAAGIIVGGSLSWALTSYLASLDKKRAQAEAKEILEKAQDAAELLEMDQKEKLLELEEEIWGKAEPQLFKNEERIEELEDQVKSQQSFYDREIASLYKDLQPKQDEIISIENEIKKFQQDVDKQKHELVNYHQKLVENLIAKSETTKQDLLQELVQNFIEDAKNRSGLFVQQAEEDVREHAQDRAKRIMAVAIDRFHRPYCAERGLGAVIFPDAQTRKNLLDAEGKNLKALSEFCGCDIYVEDANDMINIAGFDPVRRELTRRTLEKVLKSKKIHTPDSVLKIAQTTKDELFKQIKQDGDLIAKELRLENLHPEVRQMMGSLRYRYSYTQNQYFHCAEVGWLCGLLASELNLDIKKARRSGMLHDIGKSMDHAMDGGHAMIGADFIKSRNEAPDIVHAVRAHHFDEQPSTDIAFLVIAADAISGARPGARRSTMESYTQKVTNLESIATSFQGVEACYVLSGGRELRVIANNRAIDDNKAMELAKQIATRIENEMSYPGQIKVVVVRSSITHEQARLG